MTGLIEAASRGTNSGETNGDLWPEGKITRKGEGDAANLGTHEFGSVNNVLNSMHTNHVYDS